jgi:hypothetical protein
MDVYETDIHVPMRTILYLFHCLKGIADCLRYYCKIEAIMMINWCVDMLATYIYIIEYNCHIAYVKQ